MKKIIVISLMVCSLAFGSRVHADTKADLQVQYQATLQILIQLLTQQVQSLLAQLNAITLANGTVAEVGQTEQVVKPITQSTVPVPSVSIIPTPQEVAPTFNLVMTKNNQPVKFGINQYLLATFQITANKDFNLLKTTFSLSLSGTGGNISDISNIILVDSNGTVIAGPVNAVGDSHGSIPFTDTLNLHKGTETYSIVGTVADTFLANQIVNVVADKDKWVVQEPKPIIRVAPTFSINDMFASITSRSNQQNADGNFTVTLVIQSSTDLSELDVKMTKQDSPAIRLMEVASRRSGSNLYDVTLSPVQAGLYDIEMAADATRLPIGSVRIFKDTYLVQ